MYRILETQSVQSTREVADRSVFVPLTDHYIFVDYCQKENTKGAKETCSTTLAPCKLFFFFFLYLPNISTIFSVSPIATSTNDIEFIQERVSSILVIQCSVYGFAAPKEQPPGKTPATESVRQLTSCEASAVTPVSSPTQSQSTQIIRPFINCWGYKQVTSSWHHLDINLINNSLKIPLSRNWTGTDIFLLTPCMQYLSTIISSLSYTISYETAKMKKKKEFHEYQHYRSVISYEFLSHDLLTLCLERCKLRLRFIWSFSYKVHCSIRYNFPPENFPQLQHS